MSLESKSAEIIEEGGFKPTKEPKPKKLIVSFTASIRWLFMHIELASASLLLALSLLLYFSPFLFSILSVYVSMAAVVMLWFIFIGAILNNKKKQPHHRLTIIAFMMAVSITICIVILWMPLTMIGISSTISAVILYWAIAVIIAFKAFCELIDSLTTIIDYYHKKNKNKLKNAKRFGGIIDHLINFLSYGLLVTTLVSGLVFKQAWFAIPAIIGSALYIGFKLAKYLFFKLYASKYKSVKLRKTQVSYKQPKAKSLIASKQVMRISNRWIKLVLEIAHTLEPLTMLLLLLAISLPLFLSIASYTGLLYGFFTALVLITTLNLYKSWYEANLKAYQCPIHNRKLAIDFLNTLAVLVVIAFIVVTIKFALIITVLACAISYGFKTLITLTDISYELIKLYHHKNIDKKFFKHLSLLKKLIMSLIVIVAITTTFGLLLLTGPSLLFYESAIGTLAVIILCLIGQLVFLNDKPLETAIDDSKQKLSKSKENVGDKPDNPNRLNKDLKKLKIDITKIIDLKAKNENVNLSPTPPPLVSQYLKQSKVSDEKNTNKSALTVKKISEVKISISNSQTESSSGSDTEEESQKSSMENCRKNPRHNSKRSKNSTSTPYNYNT